MTAPAGASTDILVADWTARDGRGSNETGKGPAVNGQISVSVEDGVVRIASVGRASELAERVIGQARCAAEAHRSQRVLFDIRQVEMDDGFVQILDYAHMARRFGFDNRYRLAVLYPKFDEKMHFIETAALAYQLRTRVFTDPAEALSWLKG